MRREHMMAQTPVVIPTPKYWFPLTFDAVDIIQGKTKASGNASSYSSEGAYFTASSSQTLRYNDIAMQDFTTVSLEIKCATTSGLRKAITFYAADQKQLGVMYSYQWNMITLCQFLNGNSTWYSNNVTPDTFQTTDWNTITFRFNRSLNTTSVFLNGNLLDTLQQAYSQNINHRLYIGGREIREREFYGYIRNVRLWDVELTDAQIAAL